MAPARSADKNLRISLPPVDPVPLGETLIVARERLDAMFGDGGVARLREEQPTHPAVPLHERLERLSQDNRVDFPLNMSVAADLASVVIEEYLAPQPGLAADYWAFVTEATVRRHIEGSLRVPGQFADTTAELYTRARLRRDGFDAELRPPPGGRHRDQLGKRRDPGRSETPQCQRSAQGRSRAIETANRQIKRRSSGAGVAVVVLSRSAAPGTDTMPDDVQDYVQEIRASISGAHQRSVARVLLAWDDYMVMGEAPAQQLVVFRRHTHAIEHANPRAVLPGELDSIRLGGSAGFWITWQSHQ